MGVLGGVQGGRVQTIRKGDLWNTMKHDAGGGKPEKQLEVGSGERRRKGGGSVERPL